MSLQNEEVDLSAIKVNQASIIAITLIWINPDENSLLGFVGQRTDSTSPKMV